LVIALSLAALACTVGGGPTPPASPIAVSTEAAGSLEESIANALENAENGEVTLVITQEQLTSYVALKLAEDPNTPISNVQVALQEGQMVLYGTAEVGGLQAPAIIRLDVATTAEGRLEVTVAEADFGPLPAPSGLMDTLSSAINETLSGDLGPQATGVRISAVSIADGQMIVTGTKAG
jgi:hypothetical protein